MQTVQIEPILQFNSKSRTLSPSTTQHFLLQGDLANILALQSNSLKTGFTTHRPIVSSNLQLPWTSSRLLQGIASRYGYDPGLLPHGISLQSRCADSPQSFDLALLAGVRRKNATRETTNALKTWLNEHRKNPYPTKGEKIMLAILTKMTLTQVSTWFANARRRLKKENKMTWRPKNKTTEKNLDSGANSEDAEDSDNDNSSCADDEDDFEMLDDEETPGFRPECNELPRTHPQSDVAVTALACDRKPQQTSATTAITTQPKARHQHNVFPVESPIVTVQLEAKRPQDGDYGSGDSPVTSLRRWVNDCFDDKIPPPQDATSLVLTPPQTPIDRVVPTKEIVEASTTPVDQTVYPTPRLSTSVPVIMTSGRKEVSSTQDVVAKALETRPFALTTNREMDAVLALTTLCSR